MSKESGRGAWEKRCRYISILTGEARTQWGMGVGMSERRTTGRAVPVRVVSCENRYVELGSVRVGVLVHENNEGNFWRGVSDCIHDSEL